MDNTNNDKTTNLVDLADRTPEERAEIARKGGIASGEAKRKKKVLSEYYLEILAEKFGAEGQEDLKDIIGDIIKRKDSPSVSMLREIREATEGNKVEVSGGLIPEFIKNLRQE